MATSRRWILSLTAAFAAAYLVVLPAQANLTGGIFNITATNEAGDSASLTVPVPYGTSPWVWKSKERMELRSERSGQVIAILNPLGHESSVEYVDDPVVGMNFAVQAGPSQTDFSISSSLLSFTTMDGEARITVGFSLTDTDGDGAMLLGLGNPSGFQGAYLAQYNGFAGTLSGTTFAEEVQSMNASVFSSTTVAIDVPPVGFQTIADPVSDMSVMLSFSLSPNDLASGTSSFIIQPPPLSLQTASWGGVKGLYR